MVCSVLLSNVKACAYIVWCCLKLKRVSLISYAYCGISVMAFASVQMVFSKLCMCCELNEDVFVKLRINPSIYVFSWLHFLQLSGPPYLRDEESRRRRH